MKNTLIIAILALVTSLSLCSCSGIKSIADCPPAATAANGFTSPKLYKAEFSIMVKNIKRLSPDSLKAYNKRTGVPEDTPPTLMLWCSDFRDITNQRINADKTVSPAPNEYFTDKENGNTILYWNLSDKLNDTADILIKRTFTFYSYNYTAPFNAQQINDDAKIPEDIFYFYTKAEPWLEQNTEIIKIANSIAGSEKSTLKKAQAVFSYVRSKMKYVYPPEKRGALEAIKKYEGDCGQYSALFITLCRILGVPARQHSGFAIDDKETLGYHVWSEIYLPGYGWLPVDATSSEGFGHLPNNRLTASVGMNIPLINVPCWADYSEQEAQGFRTDFMQYMTVVKSGIQADITAEKIIKEIK